jgi:hypothetical protein
LFGQSPTSRIISGSKSDAKVNGENKSKKKSPLNPSTISWEFHRVECKESDLYSFKWQDFHFSQGEESCKEK